LTFSDPTNIEKNLNKDRFLHVFPNPAKTHLFIDGPDGLMVSIYNAIGEIVLRSANREIPISSLNKGIYYLKAEDLKGNSYSQKVAID